MLMSKCWQLLTINKCNFLNQLVSFFWNLLQTWFYHQLYCIAKVCRAENLWSNLNVDKGDPLLLSSKSVIYSVHSVFTPRIMIKIHACTCLSWFWFYLKQHKGIFTIFWSVGPQSLAIVLSFSMSEITLWTLVSCLFCHDIHCNCENNHVEPCTVKSYKLGGCFFCWL